MHPCKTCAHYGMFALKNEKDVTTQFPLQQVRELERPISRENSCTASRTLPARGSARRRVFLFVICDSVN